MSKYNKGVDGMDKLETSWDSHQAKELFDHIQQEIAKAFYIPPYLLWAGPRIFNRHMKEAYRATEHLRREAVRIQLAHTTIKGIME